MHGSLKLCTVRGIVIQVHWTFALLLAWIAYVSYASGGGLREALEGVVFILAVFACVALHELGHAMAAQVFGVKTRDITLLPIGGVARLERMPENPVQELVIAVAGPLVNVLIAGAIVVVLALSGTMPTLSGLDMSGGSFLARLAMVNIALVVFNLIPAFPMDGGRVLRALLAMATDRVTATRVAAGIGQVVAVGFALLGIFVNPWLLLIAAFVFLAAGAESRDVQMRSALDGLRARDAMLSDFKSLEAGDTLRTATEELLAGSQQDFPVVEAGRVVGMLSRAELLRALAGPGPDSPVEAAMRADCRPVQFDQPLGQAVQWIRESGCPAAPVLRGGELVGLLTLDNVGELVAIRSATRQGRSG